MRVAVKCPLCHRVRIIRRKDPKGFFCCSMRHPINDQTTVASYPSTPRIKLKKLNGATKLEIVSMPEKLDDDAIEKIVNSVTEKIMEKIKEDEIVIEPD